MHPRETGCAVYIVPGHETLLYAKKRDRLTAFDHSSQNCDENLTTNLLFPIV